MSLERFAEIVGACLREAGHPELADIAGCFTDDDGTFYVEPYDELNATELAVVEKAEQIATLALRDVVTGG
jgi:hypothetical protein